MPPASLIGQAALHNPAAFLHDEPFLFDEAGHDFHAGRGGDSFDWFPRSPESASKVQGTDIGAWPLPSGTAPPTGL